MKAIVIGAGLAGLTAAHYLSKAGWEVKVLESSGQVGGRAATVASGAYLFDSGAVGVGTVYKDYMELLTELGLESQIVKSSTVTATLRGGRVHEMDSATPLRSGLASKLLSWRSKLTLPKLFSDLRKISPHIDIRDVSAAAQFDDETVADYAHRRLNEELLCYFLDPLIRTLNLSRAERVSKLELMNALSGLFDTTLITLKGGLTTVPRKIAEHVHVSLQSPAESVIRHPDGVEVRYRDAVHAPQQETADACVLATTLPTAIEIFPQAREMTEPLSGSVRYNRGLCVHLGYRRRTTTKALMIMVPVPENPEIALLFLEHNKAPDRAPETHSMITIFHDDVTIDAPWGRSDQELVDGCSAFVERVLSELAGHLDFSQVTRWPLGLTHPGLGSFRHMQAMRQKLDPADRVQLAGDYLSTAGQNSAVVYGKIAAQNLIKNHG